jgi:hypothetical protein
MQIIHNQKSQKKNMPTQEAAGFGSLVSGCAKTGGHLFAYKSYKAKDLFNEK